MQMNIKIKKLLKTVKYTALLLRRNYVEEFKIKSYQKKLLRQSYPHEIGKLIVFLTPGCDIVNGGILSISSMYNETIKLKDLHRAEVIMCTIPGDPPLLKYSKFKNQNNIFRFSQVLSYFPKLRYLLIHVPEYCIIQFLRNIAREPLKLKKIEDVRVNIMIQNINLWKFSPDVL